MPTQKLMVGSNWTPVTTAADQKTIECINGTAFFGRLQLHLLILSIRVTP
ncbi:Uncharacterised protein [Serratia quinivorans]|nr:Uncharacterised protein [Serratia quinivorans]